MADRAQTTDTDDTLIGESQAIAGIRVEMEQAALSDAKVLLTGESGVGKDIVARLIHQRGLRRDMPMVAINCVGVPDSLLEAELFGHVRGSFTGAYRDKVGLLELAHRGTVFLDEVCEMTPRMQALLLRFLESGEIQRVGADHVQARLNVRVIAATNRDPIGLVASKAFREDLYYRLNVIELKIPPLRERREDIPLLMDHFLRRYAARHGVARPSLAPEALRHLVDYAWPGNIRQLKNVAERVIVRAQSSIITAKDLPADVFGRAARVTTAVAGSDNSTAEALYEGMVKDGQSFWAAVYPAFMTRDLTREDLRYIVAKGLRETSGSYKILVELLNMMPSDYKRFLNFLRKHECHVPFERFRSARASHRTMPMPDLSGRIADQLIAEGPLPESEPEEAVSCWRR
jgi:two-component system, NtrC family, response regulator AtoC